MKHKISFFKQKLKFFNPKKRENKEKKLVKYARITHSLPKKSHGKRPESLYVPICCLPVVPSEISSDDSNLRRLEYLNELSDLSGTTEGNELESLGNISHEMYKKFTFRTVEDEELELIPDEQES